VHSPAPYAAAGQQGDIGFVGAAEGRPRLAQEPIAQPGAIVNRLVDVPAARKTCRQHLAGMAQGFLESRNRAALEGQVRLELARVKQFVIHNDSSAELAFSGSLLPCAES